VKQHVYSFIKRSITFIIIVFSISNGQPSKKDGTDLQSIIGSLSSLTETLSQENNKLIFMLRFTDFGCQHCLQNFFELCDSIEMFRKKEIPILVYMLFLRDQTSPGYQLNAMTSWARSSGLLYPVALVSAEVFNRYGIEHSSILLMGRKGTLEYLGEIPLSKISFKNILRKFDK
jgi:hypothetical protein